jgi:biofilm PGA synthesis N-glycosyltransferase PgaC
MTPAFLAMSTVQWLDTPGRWWDEWSQAAAEETLHFRSLHGFSEWLGEFALLFPLGMSAIWIAFALLYVLRRERSLPWESPQSPSVPPHEPSIAVVIPARNEESGIAASIRSLLAQEYPRLHIHVVSDASEDRTVAIAREFESSGVVVHDLRVRHGKAKALQVALDAIDADLFMVLDADTTCGPHAIRAMVQQFVDPRIGGVTGNPHVENANSHLTRIQAMEYLGIIGLIKRADSFWGGLFTVSGAAACFRTSALRAVGGWSSVSVTEDIELSWRMQKAGYELAYEPRATFGIQAPTSVLALHRQRRRWARGMWEVLRMHGELHETRNASLLPMAAQAIFSAGWMLVTLASAALWIIHLITGWDTAPALEPTTALRLLVIATALFGLQTIFAALWERDYRPVSWTLVPYALLFPLYYWLILVPSFVTGALGALTSNKRRQTHWERTSREARAGSGAQPTGSSASLHRKSAMA